MSSVHKYLSTDIPLDDFPINPYLTANSLTLIPKKSGWVREVNTIGLSNFHMQKQKACMSSRMSLSTSICATADTAWTVCMKHFNLMLVTHFPHEEFLFVGVAV